MKSRTAGLAAGVLSAITLAAPPALAAPVTSNLRIEGSQNTIFEGPVTTDVRTVDGRDGSGPHPCDGTAAGAPAPSPTAGGLFATGAEKAPFSYVAPYSSQYKDFYVETIAGETPDYNATQTFWSLIVDGTGASTGICGVTLSGGEDVLLAVTTGSDTVTRLTGPATAKPGDTVKLTLVDQADPTKPVSGATVGGQKTDANGVANVVVSNRGPNPFKATKTGTIRSNRVDVCVTDGQDGFCGTTKPADQQPAGDQPSNTSAPTAPPTSGAVLGSTAAGRDTIAPEARFIGIREGQRFSRSDAPKEIRVAASDPSGIRTVKLRLTTRRNGRCLYLSGSRETFRHSRCGHGSFFKASTTGDFSYLIPERLAPGRYVLDVIAIDKAYNRDRLARGRSRIVFHVR